MTADLDLNTPCGHKYYYNVCIKCRHHQDDDLDLSPEAVRLARERICGAVNDGWSIKADDVAVILDELDRLRAERAAAWQAGAEAMRERAAYEVAESGAIVDHPSVFMGGPSRNAIRIAGAFAAAIRALPLNAQPKDGAP